MGCSTASAQAYENCGAPPQGLYGYPGTGGPFDDSIYRTVANRNKPASAPASFVNACEAMLRARGLIYYKTNPGDCGAPQAIPGITSGQIVGLSGQAASGVVGGLGTAGAISGPLTLGIGSAISLAVAGIEGIFAHHAQAVANEQTTICAVANYFNPALKAIDSAVRYGQISADQALVYIKQVGQQTINGLSGIQKTCNAACVYIGIVKAHMDFAATYYPAISPAESIAATAPGAAPDFFGTPPGGVNVSSGTSMNGGPMPPIRSTAENTYSPAGPSTVGLPTPLIPNYRLPSGCTVAGCPPDYLNIGYRQQTGQSGQAADVPPTGWLNSVNWAMVSAIVAVIALLLAVL